MSDEPTIEELIERSSLGTPAAKALRARVSDAEVAEVMARVMRNEIIELFDRAVLDYAEGTSDRRPDSKGLVETLLEHYDVTPKGQP